MAGLFVAGLVSANYVYNPYTGKLDRTLWGEDATFLTATTTKLCFSGSGTCMTSPSGGGSTISGSGSSSRVTFWSGTSTISSDSSFLYDNVNKLLSLAGDYVGNGFRFSTTSPSTSTITGTTYWDTPNGTLSTIVNGGSALQHGEELWYYAKNTSGSAMSNGQVAFYDGTSGNSGNINIKTSTSSVSRMPNYFIGVLTQDIANGGFGMVTFFGKVNGIQTNGANCGESWADGEILWVSTTTPGCLTKYEPQAPIPAVQMGVVISSHASNGTLFIRPTYPEKMTDMSDVNGTPLTSTGQLPVWDNARGVFDFNYNLNSYLATTSAFTTYVPRSYASSTFVTYGYGSSTYYFATNPSGYITSAALAPYLTTTTAATTYPTFAYSSSTFPSFSYGSSTYLNANSIINVSKLSTSTSGYVLQSLGNTAQWVATSTLGITGGGGGSGATTTINGVSGPSFTFATGSDTNIGITIVPAGSTFTWTPTWIGTLANSRIASSSFWKGYTDFSSTATGLTYTNTTGVFSLTANYVIPLSASTTNWNNTYNSVTASSSLWGQALQWDGGSTNLVAATGRTSLGLSDTATLASSTWLKVSNNLSDLNSSSTARTNLGLGTMSLLSNIGSTTITTLGTIATGVWNGTAILNQYIASSSFWKGWTDFSNTATGLTYNNTTGATSLTAGYNIPLTASTSAWNNKADYLFGSNNFSGTGSFTASGTGSFGGVEIPTLFTATKEPTGFEEWSSSSLSIATSTRIFSITGTNFNTYYRGVKTVRNTGTTTIPNVTGLYYVYYDNNGNLTATTTAWNIAAANAVPIATVYWNSAFSKSLVGDERHGITMDSATHAYTHLTVGTRYQSGLSLTANNSNATTTSGNIWDEDLQFAIPQTTTFNVVNRNGTGGWDLTDSQNAYYRIQGGVPLYDNAGASTTVSNNSYVAYWLFAGNSSTSPIISVMGQRQDNNITNARTNNTYGSLDLSGVPYAEAKLLYRVIIQNNGGTATYIEAQDLRVTDSLTGGNVATLSHNALTNLDFSSSGHTGFAGLDVSNPFTFPNTFSSSTTFLGALNDGVSSVGTAGMVLQTTGTSSRWVATSSLGLAYIDNDPWGATTTGSIWYTSAGARVGIGTSTFAPSTIVAIASSSPSYLQMVMNNTSQTATSSVDYVAANSSSTDTTWYTAFGQNGSGWNNSQWTINGKNDGYLYTNGGNLSIGTASSSYLSFFTGGTLAAKERMRIGATGTTTIGTTTTTSLLNVGGSILGTFVQTVTGYISQFFGGIRNYAGYYDSVNASGTAGQVLTSTGTSTLWATASGGTTLVGQIVAYGSSSVPTGWLSCDGSLVSTTTYSSLFSLVGYTYGGSTSTFRTPDLRGRFITMASTTLGLATTTFASTGGATSTVLDITQIPSHTHNTAGNNSGGGVNGSTVQGSMNQAAANSSNVTSGAAGGGLSHSNMVPYILMQYIIKY